MEPYETDGQDNTSAKVRRQEELLARVAVGQGDDMNDLINDVFLDGDEDEGIEALGVEVDNVLLYRSANEIGMECDIVDSAPGQKE